MTIHEEIQEQIPAYAIGALEPEEAARVKAHLDSCRRCTLLLKEYEPVANSLALAVPLREPPPDLKARTMQHVLGLDDRKAHSAASAPPPRPRRFSLRPAYALAGAAFLLVLLTLFWVGWQVVQLGQQVETQRALTTAMAYASGSPLTIHGTNAAPQAEGRLFADADENVAAIIMVGLPPLPSGRVYQAWLWQPDGTCISGGWFTVDRSGSGWLLVHAPQHLSAYTSLGVTVERAEGVTAPTSPPVLSAKLNLQ